MMGKLNKRLGLVLAAVLWFFGATSTVSAVELAPLVRQKLDYTEHAVDIPNPDRGFYQSNDGMVVPVSGPGTGTMAVGDEPVKVGGAWVSTRVSHVYFDLRHFSSNAFTAAGVPYTADFFAPRDVSIRTREGDVAPYDYDSHFDYWQAQVLTSWPRGTSQPLTTDALQYMRDKLQQVREGEGVVVVRFTYDGGGLGWLDVNHPDDGAVAQAAADMEPDQDTLLSHIAQVKPLLHEYEDVLMAVDGGFFGPWGEMHSTTLGTSPVAYAWLLNALLDAVPDSRAILVHAGAFLSLYNDRYHTHHTFSDIDQLPAPARGTPEARFGFFNDSYAFGKEEGGAVTDDWGSLSEGAGWPGSPLGDMDTFDRGKVMAWIRKQNSFYGGEAQGAATPWNTFPFVAWEAAYAQTVYLNAEYDEQVHARWGAFRYTAQSMQAPLPHAYTTPDGRKQAVFDSVYEGRTGMEYFRDRLGYRLVLRDARLSEWVNQQGLLAFEGKLQNVGFGNIVNKKDVWVLLRSHADGTVFRVLSTLDARDCHPDPDSRANNTAAYRDLRFQIPLTAFGEVPKGTYDVYLKINDPKETSANKRCIRFANAGLWDAELGANLIGTTTVQ